MASFFFLGESNGSFAQQTHMLPIYFSVIMFLFTIKIMFFFYMFAIAMKVEKLALQVELLYNF